MNHAPAPASVSPKETPVDGAPRRYDLATLRSIVATWHDRIRSRWKLARMAQENPHLLKDIGLTKHQVEAEIAKRFWQR